MKSAGNPDRVLAKRLLWVACREKKALVVLLGCVMAASVFEALGVGAVLPFIDILQDRQATLRYNHYLTWVGLAERSYEDMLVLLCLGLIAVFAAKNLLAIANGFMQAFYQNRLRVLFSTKIFFNYLYRDFYYFIEHPQGKLVQHLTSIVDQATGAMGMVVRIVVQAVTVVCIYCVLATVAFKLTLAVTLLILVTAAAVAVVARYQVYRTGSEIVHLEGLQYGMAAESISGMRIIRAFAAESFIGDAYTRIVARLSRMRIINATWFAIPTPAVETLLIAGLALFVILTTRAGQGDYKTLVPMLSMFGVGALRIMQRVSACYTDLMQITAFLPAVDKVAELMQASPQIAQDAGQPFEGLKQAIRFQEVCFGYPSQTQPTRVLHDLNLTIERGRFTAIVGPSGAGKSTIADLLIGFYRPTNGQILVDAGPDLQDIHMGSWRSRIGFVSQETFLFNGSVSDNIALGVRPVDPQKVTHAARLANADLFVQRMPQGYDTVVGERGVTLSGGERQRLAIARAVYRDPDILIFDEATSSLDTLAERDVQRAIENLRGSVTMVAIAHRLSTIMNADWIYVLSQGRIVEAGNHAALLENRRLYWELCRQQGLVAA